MNTRELLKQAVAVLFLLVAGGVVGRFLAEVVELLFEVEMPLPFKRGFTLAFEFIIGYIVIFRRKA